MKKERLLKRLELVYKKFRRNMSDEDIKHKMETARGLSDAQIEGAAVLGKLLNCDYETLTRYAKNGHTRGGESKWGTMK